VVPTALFTAVRGSRILRSSAQQSPDPVPLSFSFSYRPTLIVWGLRSPSGVSPNFDELGCHTHAIAPCSGRVRAWLWSATMTVTGGWMRRRHV
jgi:hypothetical protein